VVEQLALLNVSPAQIAKRTRMKRTDVDHAIAINGSNLAKAAHERYDLTPDQAAVAEFDDDEAVKALVAAAKTAQFDHVVATARKRREDQRARAQITAPLGRLPSWACREAVPSWCRSWCEMASNRVGRVA